MLKVFASGPQGLTSLDASAQAIVPADVVWIDLLEPTIEEEKSVESLLAVDVPTREEMKEIETSNRLYEDNGALYMTATVAAKLDTARPEIAAVTFILAKGRLITNRYIDTKPFQQFIAYAEKHPNSCQSAVAILAGLIEAFIERIADILERVGNNLDQVSSTIFVINGQGSTPKSSDLRGLIERIGFNGELNSKARESLVSLGRLVMFVQQTGMLEMTQEQRGRFRSISRDVTSLSDHASFLGSKVSFLLEATLGLINVEQNNIIKIFSVAAVMFMPPTLIASIYGMNFHLLPNLPGDYSNFFFSLGLMLASMGVTYALFKRKGWL
ncbi:MAG TPA: magnesium transporter CorA family protein [Povalibacter sp.]|uniref:magnesium transporter CorA family protein n=1 Tax=Povalibacter sp. TaxID=1962978 RepID=UPI002C02D306|nr:magnesium transporter CorA family protein [Povalibacter sp.]HMN43551.1 magnesium transporter CorA family protein [Povalibacter sp.]